MKRKCILKPALDVALIHDHNARDVHIRSTQCNLWRTMYLMTSYIRLKGKTLVLRVMWKMPCCSICSSRYRANM